MVKELLGTRPLDKLGRVVIPMELRRELGWRDGDRISIYTRGADVLLSKPTSNCVICGSGDSLNIFKSKLICEDCKNTIPQLKSQKK